MSRLALYILALLVSVILTFASPVPVINGELVEMEKRVLHTGRVTSSPLPNDDIHILIIILYIKGTWYYPGSAYLSCLFVNGMINFEL